MEPRFRLHDRGDQRRIDVVLLRLLVDDVAKGNCVGEEIAADGRVDSSHLFVKDIELRLLLLSGQRGNPAIIEQSEPMRDHPVRKETGKFEHRVRGEAVVQPGHNLIARSLLLLHHPNGIEVLLHEEMDALKSLRRTADRECGAQRQRRCGPAHDPPDRPAAFREAAGSC